MEFNIERTYEVLSATPPVVSGMLSGLSVEWTAAGTADAWGPYDIVGHLNHCERADWIARAQMILDHGESRTFEPLDRLAHLEASKGKPIEALIAEFAALRRGNLAILRAWRLTGEQLGLTGTHPAFGTVSLRQLLAAWAVHDMTHIRQLATVIAKKYELAVGPWREYLSILK